MIWVTVFLLKSRLLRRAGHSRVGTATAFTPGRFFLLALLAWSVILLPMCFSATASFAAAALTGAAGVATLRRTRRLRDIPLASVPLIFGTQQAVEGALWLGLRADPVNAAANQVLAAIFTGIALILWPALAPLAVGLAERKKSARLLIYALIPVGIILAVYSAFLMMSHPYAPTIVNASICYISGTPYPAGGLMAYVLCTCLPPLLSTNKFLRAAGIAIVVGLAVSAVFYYEGFFSVWCFFAALASVAIFGSLQSQSALTHAAA